MGSRASAGRRRVLAESHTSPIARRLTLVLLTAISALSAGTNFRASVSVFGPETYTRGTGAPIADVRSFTLAAPANPYQLRVVNHGVTSAVIAVNGVALFGPGDFKGSNTATATLEAPVTLQPGSNHVSVELRGQPGRWLTVDISVEPGNHAPVARIVPIPEAFVAQAVTLDGRASSDPDGSPLTFDWSFVSHPLGSAAVITNSTSALASLIPDRPGTYHLRFTVSDGALTAAADVIFTTTNTPPVANAGPDQTVAVRDLVSVSANASADVDGDPLTYEWSFDSKPAGSLAELSDPSGVSSTFVADVFGTYVLRVGVSDGAATRSDTVSISTRNSKPVANAGLDRSARVGESLQLDGTHSTDIDGQSLTYAWTLLARPAGSTAALQLADSAQPTLVPDRRGPYEVQLIVSDGTLVSDPDTVLVTTENTPPVAHAGDDQTAKVDDTVRLNGSGSTDADGDPLTFTWALLTRPASSASALSDPTLIDPTFTLDRSGTYILQLMVNDGLASSAADTVVIDTTNSLPVAHAGDDQTVSLGATVTLDGLASSDADGDTLTYAWALLSKPAGSTATLTTPLARLTTFVADRAGTYIAQLIVNDGTGNSVPDTVTISTSNSAPTANAGPDQIVHVGAKVALDGHLSRDPDDTPLTYAWALTSKPNGSLAILADPTTAFPTFVADQPGAYAIQLVVNDGDKSSQPDTVLVRTNSAPVVSAGPDLTITLPSAAMLEGSALDDGLPDGQLTIAWRKVSGPGEVLFGIVPSLKSPASFSVPGEYLLRLTVSDGDLESSDDVTVTVLGASVNRAPVVNAGPDLMVALNAEADLGASVLDDGLPAGQPVNQRWTQVSGPGVATFLDSAALHTSAKFTAVGTYVLRLTASDGELASADEVTVTVTGPACVPIPQGLVGWWPGNGNAVDVIGGNNGSVVRAVTFAPGLASQAFSFPGSVYAPGQIPESSTNYVDVPGASALDMPGPFAIELWARVNSLGNQKQQYLLIKDSEDNFGQHENYQLRVFGDAPPIGIPADATGAVPRGIGFGIGDGTGREAGFYQVFSKTSLTVGVWYHIAAVFDGNNQKLYVNGNLEGVQVIGPKKLFTTPTKPLRFGIINEGVDYWWYPLDGMMDEVSLYNRALSATEVQTIYQAGGAGKCLPPGINNPPSVDAGPDQSVTLPAAATLNGSVEDDGLPTGHALTYSWSQQAGPALATFETLTSSATTVSFSAAGVYTLRLTASDGELDGFDDVQIAVLPAAFNEPPNVSAGPDRSVAAGTAVTLNGSIYDDGLPAGSTLTATWGVRSAQTVSQAWIHSVPVGTVPFPVSGSTNAPFSSYDSNTNRVIVFGGTTTTPSNEVWVLSHANGLGSGSVWSRLAPTGPAPVPRYSQSSYYDPSSNRLIVFGGIGPTYPTAKNDTWILTNANGTGGPPAWLQLFPTGSAPGARFNSAVAYDAVTNTLMIVGGDIWDASMRFYYPTNEIWILSNANGTGPSAPSWRQLTPAGSAPEGRGEPFAAYDPASNRLIVFGGIQQYTRAGDFVERALNDVWVLTNANGSAGASTWAPVTPNAGLSSPAARWPGLGAYNASNNTLVVGLGFSCQTGPLVCFPLSDVWSLTDANGLGGSPTWTQLTPTGEIPDRVYGSGYDAATDRLIGLNGANNDTWILTNATNPTKGGVIFSQSTFSTANIGGQSFAVPVDVTLSAPGTYVLQLIGSDGVFSNADDVSIVATEVGPNQAPVVNAGSDQLVQLPGAATLSGIATDDGLPTGSALVYSWTKVSGPGSVSFSSPSSSATAASFELPGSYVLRVTVSDGDLSGSDDVVVTVSAPGVPSLVSVTPSSAQQGQQNLSVLIRGQFTNFTSGTSQAAFGEGVSVGGGPLGGFGPVTVTSPTSAVASLNVASRPTWVQSETDGPAPKKYQNTLAFDPISNQVILFGGRAPLRPSELWRLSNANGTAGTSTWLQVEASGPRPVGRSGSSGVYDPVSDRMVIYGGDCVNELWILTSAAGRSGTPTWMPVSPTGAPPPPRYAHSAAYDPKSNRMMVLGGNNCSTTEFTDIWVLSNANGTESAPPAWTQLAPVGPIPGPAVSPGLVYDILSNRLILFGQASNGGFGDGKPVPGPGIVWVLENANGLGGPPHWTRLHVDGAEPPTATAGVIAYDPSTNRLLISATDGYDSPGMDTWTLTHANGLGGAPAWSRQGPFLTLPSPRYNYPNAAGAYDVATDRLILVAGISTAVGPPFYQEQDYPTDTWVLTSAIRGPSVGVRSVEVITGTEQLTLVNGFVVTSSSSPSALLSPAYGPKGATGLTVAITGEGTNFKEGVTQASFGPGVSVGGGALGAFGPVTVTSPTTAVALLAIDAGAVVAVNPVTIHTGVEEVSPAGGFFVSSDPDTAPLAVSPAVAEMGQSLAVVLTAFRSHFSATTLVSFGSGIAVDSLSATSATSMTVHVTVEAGATLGPRTVTAATGTEKLVWANAFAVLERIANLAPVVSAGPDQGVFLPGSVVLEGHATDDGRPTGSFLSYMWTVVTGPGPVAFTNASNPMTTASFSQAGVYFLRLSASDSELTAFDDLQVTVLSAVDNRAPLVSAGPAQTIALPSGVTLAGTVSDDGFPTGSLLTGAWSVLTTPETAGQEWLGTEFTGISPSAGARALGTVFDANTNRLIMFGGTTNAPSDAVWVLAGANALGTSGSWTKLQPTGGGPGPRFSNSATYDPGSNRLVVFGGIGPSYPQTNNDVWVLTNASGIGGAPEWIRVQPLGTAPVPRFGAGAVYDSATNRMVVFGGTVWSDPRRYYIASNEIWILTNANGMESAPPTWISVTPTGITPVGRSYPMVAYDRSSRRLMVFGGYVPYTPAGTVIQRSLNDAWVLTNANGIGGPPLWLPLTVDGDPGAPSERSAQGGYNPANNTLIVGLGAGHCLASAGTCTDLSDIWILRNANGLDGAPAWTQLVPTGNAPTLVTTTTYDAATDRLIVFSETAKRKWVLTNATDTVAPAVTLGNPTSSSPNVAGQVLAATTSATFSAPGSYVLRLTGSDSQLSSSSDVTITVRPPPGDPFLVAIAPNAGHQSQSGLSATITGQNTHFVQGTSSVDFGGGISVSSFTVTSETSGIAVVNIGPSASTGARTVTVATGNEVAQQANGFTVLPVPSIAEISPSSGSQGTQASVSITGIYTGFVEGLSRVDFGIGITVSNVHVMCAGCLTADIAISPTAPTGPHGVTVTTGTEVATVAGGFTVLASQVPSLTQIAIAPAPTAFVIKGQALTFSASGTFSDGSVQNPLTGVQWSSDGPGAFITVVGQATGQLTGVVQIRATRDGVQSAPTALTVVPLPPAVLGPIVAGASAVSGSSAEPAAVVQVFVNGAPRGAPVVAGAGGGWAVGGVAPAFVAGDILTARQTVNGIPSGLSAEVVVVAPQSVPRITSSRPLLVRQGQQNVLVSVDAVSSNFSSLQTRLSLGSGIAIGGAPVGALGPVNAQSATSLTAFASVDTCAVPGARELRVQTGGAVLSLSPALTVIPSGWALLDVTGAPPNGLAQAAVAYDAQTSRTIVFGGTRGASLSNEVWVLSPPTWTKLQPSGLAPAPRRNHSVAYDSENNRLIVFGGNLAGGSIPSANDVWILTNANGLGGTPTWIQLSPQGSLPIGRRGAASGYDPTTNRFFIFGGWTNDLQSVNDTWVLSNANGLGGVPAWTQLNPAGPLPLTRSFPFFSYDAATNRLIVFGGLRAQNDVFLDDTWVLVGANGTGAPPRWVELIPAGLPQNPSARAPFSTPAAYNTTTNRMLIVGGAVASGGLATDTWILTNANGLGGVPTWVPILDRSFPAQSARSSGLIGGVYDQGSDILLQLNEAAPTEAWALSEALTLPSERSGGAPCAPSLRSWAPARAAPSEALLMQVEGLATNFVPGQTTIDLGLGITVDSVVVADSAHVTAVVTVAGGATLGPRNLTVTTGAETVSAQNAFRVEQIPFGTPAISSVLPPSAQQGSLQTVSITGSSTNFLQGATQVAFGPGVAVGPVTVHHRAGLTVEVAIDQAAAVGPRTVTITTGSETVTLADGFTITAGSGIPSLAQVLPGAARQGQRGPVTIVGLSTHFVQGVSQVGAGLGVTATNVSVTCATCLSVVFHVADDAPAGPRDVTVTTGAEVATLRGGFTVQPGIPILASLSPASGRPGETFGVTVTGRFTHFAQGTTQVDFGAGITVSNVTVSSATSLSAQVSVSPTATLGPRPVTVATGAEVAAVANVFTVTTASATLTALSPSAGRAGQQRLDVLLSGQSTNWAQGETTVSFGPGVSIDSVTVAGPASLTARISITPNATLGGRTVIATTGSEVALLVGGFTILPGIPRLAALSRASVGQGETLPVVITGEFTSFVNGRTEARFGQGISVGGAPPGQFGPVTVTSPTTAIASLTVWDPLESTCRHASLSIL